MPKRNFNSLIRWLHLYLSMFGFTTLFFFAFTGITLNHPGWIEGKPKVKSFSGIIDPNLVKPDIGTSVDRGKIVELLKKKYSIRGKITDFRIDENECSLSFTSPGYRADAFIDRMTGSYQLVVASKGLLTVLNDMHKGRDTRAGWSMVIDISAVIFIIVSITGFLMIFYISRRKKPGLLVTIIGALTFLILCIVFN